MTSHDEDVSRAFLNAIKDHEMITAGDLVLVAVSGGPDSLTLLHLFNKWKELLGIRIHAACMDHGLRGSISREEALWVGKICEEWGIQYTLSFREEKDIPGLSPQDSARRARRIFLLDTLQKIGGQKIAQGHQADDQAETLLMRMIQGAGIQGMSGIWPVRDVFIRPLLYVDKKLIEEYCGYYGLEPRRDLSNNENNYLRNHIRNELIPLIKAELNPHIAETLGKTASVFQSEHEFLEDYTKSAAAQVLSVGADSVEIRIDLWRNYHIAVQRRIIRCAFRALLDKYERFFDLPPGWDACERVRKLALFSAVGKRVNLPGKITVIKEYNILRFQIDELSSSELISDTCDDVAIPLVIPGITELPDGRQISARILVSNELIEPASDEKLIPWSKVIDQPVLRHRLPGDRICRPGGSSKLKKYMIDIKTPRDIRDKVWVLAVGAVVYWFEGSKFNWPKQESETWLVLRLI